MELKFDLDDSVKIKGTDKVGIVKSYKVDVYKLNGKRQEVAKYCVQTGASYQVEWHQEHHLEYFELLNDSCDFDNEFEIGLADMLIDIYLLDERNLDLIKRLHNEKQQFM